MLKFEGQHRNKRLAATVHEPKRVHREDALPVVSVPQLLAQAGKSQQRGYSTGAIIAVRLVDFQVAKDATYRFEPYLNMILGSNGSGKSTVVTALFLLFRGRISDLQHRSYGEFVRHGCDRAVLSVVLQGRDIQARMNPVIALVLHSPAEQRVRDRAPPQWYINGAPVSSQDIDEFIETFNIQVNNLCQFLPQFRVSAFSGETKEQRLKSTEEAVGYAGMVEDHEFLTSIDNELATVTSDLGELRTLIARLTARKEELEGRLAAIERAAAAKEHVEFMQHTLRLAERRALEHTMRALDANLAQARAAVDAFDSQQDLVRGELQACDTRLKQLRAHRDELRGADDDRAELSARVKARRDGVHRALQRVTELDKLTNQLKETRAEAASARQDQIRLAVERRDAEDALALVATPEFAERISRRNELQKSIQALLKVQQEARRAVSKAKAEFATAQRSLTECDRDRKALVERMSRGRDVNRVRDVLRYDRGALAKAVDFVRRRASDFEEPVIEPAILTLAVTDKRALPLVGAAMSVSTLAKFVCQTARDQQKLAQLAADNNISLASVHVKDTPADPTDADREQIKDLGFDGYIIDVLDGPPVLMRYMRQLSMHTIPFAYQQLPRESLVRLRELGNISRFIDKSESYRVVTSRYGNRKLTEISEKVKQTPPWATFMLREDLSMQLARLEEAVARARPAVNERQVGLERAAETEQGVQSQMAKLQTQINDLLKTVGEEERLSRAKERAETKLAAGARRIERLEALEKQQLSEVRRARDEAAQSIQLLSSAVITPEMLERIVMEQARARRDRAITEDLRNKSETLKRSLRVMKQELEERVKDLESERTQFVNEHAQDYVEFENSERWLQEKGMRERADELVETKKCEELRSEVLRLQQGLTMHEADQYNLESLHLQMENTTTQLAEATQRMELDEARQAGLGERAREVRSRWEGELSKMVDSASEEFARMFHQLGCQGRVGLAKDDERAVGTWGIDIFVSFRAREEPSRLSRVRQSGGERAVSTAVYLLALQQMAKAPFRVLDEINQGMDESNERKTMEFFVQHACDRAEGKAQQYFLVSPKLIPNIPVNRRMNITFITGSAAVGDTDRLIPSTNTEERDKWLRDEVDDD